MGMLEDIYDKDVREDTDSLTSQILKDRFDHREQIPEEPYYPVRIKGKGIALEGASLLGIYGQPKSRKSTFASMIAASILNKDKKHENIETDIDGAVLWIDTEQSSTEVAYFAHDIINMAGRDPVEDDDYLTENFIVLKLRRYDEEDRLRAVDRILTSELLDNIGAIFIDGIADFTYNVNELDTSKKLVTRVMQWVDLLDVFCVTTLHTNKDGGDATGALGGFLNKKASYTIKTVNEYETGPTQIRPYYIRDGNKFEPFLINNNEETGVPQIYHPEEDLPEVKGSNRREEEDEEVNKEVYEHPADREDDGKSSSKQKRDEDLIADIEDTTDNFYSKIK